MRTSTENQVKGTTRQIKGKVKQETGRITRNRSMHSKLLAPGSRLVQALASQCRARL